MSDAPERVWIRMPPEAPPEANYGVWMEGGPFAGYHEYIRADLLPVKDPAAFMRDVRELATRTYQSRGGCQCSKYAKCLYCLAENVLDAHLPKPEPTEESRG